MGKIYNIVKKITTENSPTQRYTLLFIICLGLYIVLAPVKPPSKGHSQDPWSVDTSIPKGHVLIPITVHNLESVDHLLGQFGIVNLYSVEIEGGLRKEPVAKSVKILRSPLKSNVFAVLAPEKQAHHILKNPQGFIVVIQNPKHIGTNFEVPNSVNKKTRRQIIYGD